MYGILLKQPQYVVISEHNDDDHLREVQRHSETSKV